MKRVLVAAIALSTLLGSAAMADSDDRDRGRHERHESNRRDHHRYDGRHNDRHDYRGGRYDDHRAAQRRDRDDRRWNDRDDDDRRWDRRHREDHRSFHHPYRYGYDHHNRYRVGRYYRPHGYRHYVWHNGARLPPAYYAPRYVVHDYGSYRLRHPPHGYHWVRVDNDVLLAAIATGVVVQVVNGLFYY